MGYLADRRPLPIVGRGLFTKRGLGDADMLIKTKYDIGRTVWYLSFATGKPESGVIRQILIDEKEIYYILFVPKIPSPHLKENQVFPTEDQVK